MAWITRTWMRMSSVRTSPECQQCGVKQWIDESRVLAEAYVYTYFVGSLIAAATAGTSIDVLDLRKDYLENAGQLALYRAQIAAERIVYNIR